MKKVGCVLLSMLVLILSVFSLCACTWLGIYKWPSLVNVVWRTDANEYGIDLTFTVLDHQGDNYGSFTYEDKVYDIKLGWSKRMVDIHHIGYYGNTIRSGFEGKEFAIDGRFTIVEKNVVEIEFVYVNGDFEELQSLVDKVITVRATEIDPDECDVGDISEVMWQSKNTEWKLYTYYSMRKFSVGTYGTDNKTDIAVFWLANNTFKAYKLKEGNPPDNASVYFDIERIDGDAFIVGTYTNDSKQLNLTYTIEGETQPRFSTLYCQAIDDYSTMYPYWYPSSPDAAHF